MEKDLIYNISSFVWDNKSKTFSANSADLYPMKTKRYMFPFPSNGRQFYIENIASNGKMRFRLAKETSDSFEYTNEGGSRDVIRCMIFKTLEIANFDNLKHVLKISPKFRKGSQPYTYIIALKGDVHKRISDSNHTQATATIVHGDLIYNVTVQKSPKGIFINHAHYGQIYINQFTQ